MKYSDDKVQELRDFQYVLKGKQQVLLRSFITLSQSLQNENAKEFLFHGACRRLKIITRCLENVFDIFPVDREDKLSSDELSDIAINIHAHFINIAGLFDNLGWVFVYENDLHGQRRENKLNNHDIGLFSQKTQARLKPHLNEYLTKKR